MGNKGKDSDKKKLFAFPDGEEGRRQRMRIKMLLYISGFSLAALSLLNLLIRGG